MKLKHKCQCHLGHTGTKPATEPDGLCEPCHDRTAEELARITEQDKTGRWPTSRNVNSQETMPAVFQVPCSSLSSGN
jgi:hypothetical protein